VLVMSHRMGHTDPSVTLQVYGHLFAGAQEDLTRRLDDLRLVSGDPASGEVVQLEQVRRSLPARR
jgi:hypothetical protein